ncbi:MAG: restriction endonuclease subunit S [Verrucomicrobiales bacterium]|nr:restriction endonuclease subunit S [Verrucomicrobiales bacterium]
MIEGLKPYAEYKESGQKWLGAVPAHWELKPGHAAFAERRVSNVGLKENTVLSLSYGRIKVKPVEKQHGLVPKSYETYQIVDDGNIIIRGTDMQNDHTSLRIGLSKNRGIISSAYICLQTRKSVTPSFGYEILNTFDITKAIYRYGSGLRQNLGYGDIKRLPIFLPPPDEQAAIVRFLDHANGKIERFIRAKRKLIGLLNEQKQAIIHRAVTRGLDPNAPLKPSGIPWLGDIPRHWELQPLKSVCSIQSGITLGKDYAGQPVEEYPYLRVANVQAGHARLDVVKTLRVPKSEAQRSMLRAGDVLMTEGGDPDKLGRGCVWEAPVANCLHQNHVFAVRPKQKRLNPYFLTTLMGLVYARAYFQMTAKQTTNLAATNKTKIGMFKILLPSVEEQKGLLAVVDAETRPLTTAIARTEREIALMQEYRTRLTADVVTGKLDVRAAAAKLPELASRVLAAADPATDDEDPDPEDT